MQQETALTMVEDNKNDDNEDSVASKELWKQNNYDVLSRSSAANHNFNPTQQQNRDK